MDEKLLNRVRGLLAKAEATTFPQEAETLTAKAAELASKYGIDEAMLAAAGKSADRIDRTQIDIGNPYSAEKAMLLGSIAVVYRCRTLTYGSTRNVQYAVLFGYGVDRERTELLYTSLLLQATSQVRHQWPLNSAASVTLYRRSWWLGFAMAVQDRLAEIELAAQCDAKAQETIGTPGTALVLADRAALVTEAFDQAYPDLEYTGIPEMDIAGVIMGTHAGANADLGGRRLGRAPSRALS